MADDSENITKSKIWSMTIPALENALRIRNVPIPTKATRDTLRNLLRTTINSKETEDDENDRTSQAGSHTVRMDNSRQQSRHASRTPSRQNSRAQSRLPSPENNIPPSDNERNDPRTVQQEVLRRNNYHVIDPQQNHIDPRLNYDREREERIRLFRNGFVANQPQVSNRAPYIRDNSRPRSQNELHDFDRRSENNEDIREISRDSLAERVRKWGVSFDGKGDVLSFLERIEELSYTYEIPLDNLLTCLPMLLKGKAILWYRNNRKNWYCWENFELDIKEFFLPVNLNRQLEDDIRNRTQGPKENAHDYITALQTLIRRYGNMSLGSEIERLYINLRPEYRRYIRRNEIRSVTDLIRLTNEFELIVHTQKNYKPPPQSMLNVEHKTDSFERVKSKENVSAVDNKYDRYECCWRCGQRGHRRQTCKNPPKKFCSYCGKPGVFFLDCKCEKSENAKRIDTKKPAEDRSENRIHVAGNTTATN